MNIETITIVHPNLRDRKITLLLVDDNIDIASTEFLSSSVETHGLGHPNA